MPSRNGIRHPQPSVACGDSTSASATPIRPEMMPPMFWLASCQLPKKHFRSAGAVSSR
jgi:hypothetical protein